ncbi:hypothetical protein P3L10_004084 [Capsicum annuum]
MEDYGVKESWTELFTIQVAGFLLVIPKYRFSDGELLHCCRDLAFRPVFRTSKGPLGLCPQSNSSQKESIALPHPKSSSQKIYTCGLGCGSTIDYNILKILLLLILWIEYSICVEGSGYATAQDIILPAS